MDSVRIAFYLGSFLGVTELLEKGYINSTHFTSRCIEIAAEYAKEKAQHAAKGSNG